MNVVSAVPEVANEERPLVFLPAGIGAVPSAGPEEDTGPRETGSCGRQVDLDR